MFRAGMNHTEETCLRLAQVQDTCFGRMRDRIRILLAAVPFLAGMFIGPDTLPGVLLIVFACFFYYKTGFMYRRDAEQAFQKTPERFRKVFYDFGADGFSVCSGGKEVEVPYQQLYALREDPDFGYLFLNGQQAYMFSWNSLKPKRREEFCRLVGEASGRSWETVRQRWSMTEFLHQMRGTGS